MLPGAGASLLQQRAWNVHYRKSFGHAMLSSPVLSPRPIQQRLTPLSAFKSNPKYNSYRDRQTVEKEYYREWERTAALTESYQHRQRTALSTAATLPGVLKYYFVPGPLRFVWFFIWQALLTVLRQLQKRLLLLGSRLEAGLRERARLKPGGLRRRLTLLRWHGRIPLTEDAKYWGSLLLGKDYEPQLTAPEPGDYGPNYMPHNGPAPPPQPVVPEGVPDAAELLAADEAVGLA